MKYASRIRLFNDTAENEHIFSNDIDVYVYAHLTPHKAQTFLKYHLDKNQIIIIYRRRSGRTTKA